MVYIYFGEKPRLEQDLREYRFIDFVLSIGTAADGTVRQLEDAEVLSRFLLNRLSSAYTKQDYSVVPVMDQGGNELPYRAIVVRTVPIIALAESIVANLPKTNEISYSIQSPVGTKL